MRVGLDTNVLIYAQGFGDPVRVARALEVVGLLELSLVVPAQVIGETYNVLAGKYRLSIHDVLEAVGVWTETSASSAGSLHAMFRALHLASDHRFQIWDAFIIESAVEAGCKILLSEDMQHGFYWNGLTIINPFLDPIHPLLTAAFDHASGLR
jgi:predicted nucleic acid-binding protein